MSQILIVQKQDQAGTLQTLLERYGHTVAVCEQSAKALAHARRDPPDLILSEMEAPGIDGLTLCRRWKLDPQLQAIPFVFYVAPHAGPEAETLADSLGADLFFARPMEPERLLKLLRDLLDRTRAGKLPLRRYAEDAELVALRAQSLALMRVLREQEESVAGADYHRGTGDVLYRALFDAMQEAVVVVDNQARLLDVNPAFCQLLGYTRGELFQKTIWQIMPLLNLQLARELWDSVEEKGKERGEYALLRKDGSRVLVTYHALVSVLPGVHIGILRDITGERERDRELRESEESFRTLFESAPVGIAISGARGSFILVNRAFEEMLGYSADELVAMSWRDVTHAEDIAESERQSLALYEGRQEHFQLEKRYVRKDGSIVWANLMVVRSETPDGHPTAVAFVRDVTEHREALEELSTTQMRLSRLLHLIHECVVVLDSERLVSYLNPAAEALLGGRREEIVGRPLLQALSPAQAEMVERQLAEAQRAQRDVTFELSLGAAPDERWYEVRICRYEEGFIVLFEQITALRQLQEQLRRLQR